MTITIKPCSIVLSLRDTEYPLLSSLQVVDG